MINRKGIRLSMFLTLFSLFAAKSGFSQVSLTAQQLFTEFHENFNAFKEKYQGKTLQVTGKVKYVNVSDGEVYVMLTNDGFNTPVEFVFSDEPVIRNIARGSTITAQGTLSRIFAGSLGKAQFKPCTLVSTEAATNEGTTKTETTTNSAIKTGTPKDMPLGEYSVYQGGNFQYQYRVTFYANGTYKQFDTDMGKYKYDRATKVLKFLTGPLEGFVGLYYTKGRNNDKGEPMIAIDFDGNVPNISNASNGQYQYAIYQGH